ncbi:MAG TPA: PEGA domain-containing protein [Candidatus Angelobacter sp.]|nr:PEGA domain-containing protein [Candidatus Angelobacter sp.]
MQENPETITADTATATATAPTAPRTDRLELVKELPKGSIGAVHQARNPQQNKNVVLRKFEVPEWLDDAGDLIKKIVAEAKTASTLDHPNIAKLYTCGYKDFTVFMTAEFIEGQTLREVMQKRQPEMAEVLQFAKQLCAAADAAHAKGVFHNFLNPSNIKIQSDGTLKVLDFGLLRDKNLLTQTPAKKLENEPYLSPEQVRNRPADRAANIFSLGTILYELYTARSPFHGKHLGEVDRSITDVNPHPLGMAHPRVPEAISNVILKALAKNPAERYASGEKLIAALEEAAKAEPVARANATGSRPAYQGGAVSPSGSQQMKASQTGSFNISQSMWNPPAASQQTKASQTGSFNISQSMWNPPSPSASQSFKAMPSANSSQVIRTPSPGTTRVPVQQAATSRARVQATNHWKLVGLVVGGLCLILGLAMIFQHRPAGVSTENASEEPANSAATAPAPFSQPSVAGGTQTQPESQAQTQSPPPRAYAGRSGRAAKNARVAPAPPPAPSEGQLIVSSVPMGATVEIEGRPGQSWKAPQTVTGLAPGTYKVTFSMPGYAPETRSIQVTSGARTPMDVKLNPVKGFITIAGSPAGAEVFINGRDTGRVTPIEFMVDPGPQNIVLRKSGYLDASTDLKMVAGQTANYAPSMMAAGRTDNIRLVNGGMGKVFGGSGSSQGKARIEIKSEPKGALVTVNGTPLQKTTPVEIQVEPGSYDITIEKDGYKPIKESAIVGIDDRVKIDKALSH